MSTSIHVLRKYRKKGLTCRTQTQRGREVEGGGAATGQQPATALKLLQQGNRALPPGDNPGPKDALILAAKRNNNVLDQVQLRTTSK